MKIITTAREALKGGYWADLCAIKGWAVWSASEGIVSEDKEIELTEEEARTLDII